MRTKTLKRLLRVGAVGLLIVAVAIQLVPYGRDHTNPPVTMEASFDSAATRELARRACYDCHSNETEWPWYTHVAPVSWLIQDHVDEGRAELNFSEWDKPQPEAHEAAEVLAEGEMPPWSYTLGHPEAQLTEAETRQLTAGLSASFGGEKNAERVDEHD